MTLTVGFRRRCQFGIGERGGGPPFRWQLGGTQSAMSALLTERVTGDSAEKKRHRKPMDPDAKRKEHETTQFHRARGQMMTYNNLALPLKSKRALDVDDSQTKKLKVGTLPGITVVTVPYTQLTLPTNREV